MPVIAIGRLSLMFDLFVIAMPCACMSTVVNGTYIAQNTAENFL